MKRSNKKQKSSKEIRDDIIELPTGPVKIGPNAVPLKKALEGLREAAKKGIFPPITTDNG